MNATPTDLPVREMTAVHSAMRRDFVRAHLLLRGEPLDAERRRLLGTHVAWVIGNLHHHHESEDTHLWPELLRRAPDLAQILERMDADHVAIGAPMERVERTAAAFAEGTASAEEFDDAITAFAVNWLLDNADADGRAVFLDPMPAPIRFLFLRVLARPYTECRRRLWEGTVAEGVPPTR